MANYDEAIQNLEMHYEYLIQQLAQADRNNVIAAADDVLKLSKVIDLLKGERNAEKG